MAKNYCKKTLAGIFAFAIVASAIPLAPFATNGISLTASAETYFKDGFNYEIENGECTITGYPGYGDAQIVIPDNFDGVPVTAIGSQSLNMLFNTTSIVIPNTVKTIGTNAFASCTALTTCHNFFLLVAIYVLIQSCTTQHCQDQVPQYP